MGRSVYHGSWACLATRHDKAPLISPAMGEILGLEVRSVDVDTDSLGTFTGEIERVGSMFDVAVAKARLGMAASGHSIGMASEGSIAPPPDLPWLIHDLELVVLVDDTRNLAIGELASSYDIVTVSEVLSPDDDLQELAARADFPHHGLIVRPTVGGSNAMTKGIRSWSRLRTAVTQAADLSGDGRVIVETDLRAHMCPSRRPTIAAAARKLADRMARLCPSCHEPGWGVISFEAGAECRGCGAETPVIRFEIVGCVSCGHETRNEVRPFVDESRCTWCNP